MRNFLLWIGVLLGVMACGSEGTTPDAGPGSPDAMVAVDASVDAAPAPDTSTPDATTMDAAADAEPEASTPDATTPPGCTPGTGTTPVGGGAIRDERTCLTWTTTRHAEGMAWGAIRQACEDLVLEGFDDWRMPTTQEALTWPIGDVSPTFYDAVLTAPRYVPAGTAAGEVDGRFHVCAVAWYSGSTPACYWWGPANTNGTFCVRGEGVGLPTISDGCGTVCANVESWDSVAD